MEDFMDKLLKILEGIKPGIDFKNEQHIISNQVLTSMEIVRLVMEISDEFDVTISPLKIIPENFETVDAIMHLIEESGDE
jgi:acyl carrier protein